MRPRGEAGQWNGLSRRPQMMMRLRVGCQGFQVGGYGNGVCLVHADGRHGRKDGGQSNGSFSGCEEVNHGLAGVVGWQTGDWRGKRSPRHGYGCGESQGRTGQMTVLDELTFRGPGRMAVNAHGNVVNEVATVLDFGRMIRGRILGILCSAWEAQDHDA